MVQTAPHLESLNRRTRRRMDLSQGNYDGLDEGRTYYYSAGWQMLEEHVDTDLDDDTDRIGQQFWGVRYIDDAVARRVDRDGDGDRRMQECSGQSGDLEPSRSGVHILGPAPFQAACRRS